ncbi:hypothetical protein [Neorhizobium petrolearium]|uniref:Uncharacterized protein n=1 Tax=Neorhizobium petrolearium TaxID=515361 RepID=A0ABY8M293_9HYPH|nr:hypothetical protein [Neorhizobium petrolearium]MCC2608394.1 hypothetical protein [Neorhizobium petrolearium]WGI68672.1 hypothetical protein QEO92_00800 [Neorhizobium petrolearium]
MLSETIRWATRGHRVHCVILAELQFDSGTMYVHNEGGILRSRGFDGQIEAIDWKGLQGLATVSGLGASKIGAARQVTCTLNVESANIKEWFFEREQREIKGRRFRFWRQFYDADLQPLDPRGHVYTGLGDRLKMSKSGPSSRQIVLMLEDYFVRRRRSANSMVTHSDQQQRDPGSTGFMYVQKMVDQTLNLFDARN